MDDEKFERKILGLHFKSDRLKELQDKAKNNGLRGDEVFEFIHLDRKELVDLLESERLKARKWEAFINSDAIRILGSAGLGNENYQHIGFEIWDGVDSKKYEEYYKKDFAVEIITKYVDTIIKRNSKG